MDMKISGSGRIGSGEYDNIRISGSGKVEGPVRCRSFHCSGSSSCTGKLEAREDVHISGSTHIGGDVNTNSLHVSGSCHIDGNCTARAEAKISGGFRCNKDLKANLLRISGGVYAANIEAEEANISGKITCPGLLNAERIEIRASNGSEIGSIGGSIIEIGQSKGDISNISINLFFFKYNHSSGGSGHLTVKEAIEGDEITLDHVTAKQVVGRIVKIGPGCRIEHIQYSESIEIDPDAKVENHERI